jgi:hypothetical protein
MSTGDFHDNGVCPHCGHCKHCGRGPSWPYYVQPHWVPPYWVPNQPWPGSTIVVGGNGVYVRPIAATNVMPNTYTVYTAVTQ